MTMSKSEEQEVHVDPRFFNDAYLPYLEDDTELQIFLGGGGSGKSVFLAQRCALDMLLGGRNYLIARKVGDTLRDSVYSELKSAINGFGEEFASAFTFGVSPLVITCIDTGCVAMFKGLDDVQKVKSIRAPNGPLTDLWVEEATEISASDLDQLWLRLRGRTKLKKRQMLSFNPVHNRHWIAKTYCTSLSDDAKEYREPGLSILRTTYLDNRFLTKDDIAKYDKYKETNPAFYRVYGLGLWGTLGNVIFTKWVVEEFDINDYGQLYNGVDFGFAADPTACARVAVRGDDVYICYEFVSHHMTNKDIYDVLSPVVKDSPVSCDCAEPKSIAELCSYGMRARPCTKGPDSVMHRIQWMLNKKIHIHPSCKTAAHEFAVMEWDKDRNGESINRPVDKDNHMFDAICYAIDNIITNKNTVPVTYGHLKF
jgi:phage terminase large subunit